MALSNNVLILSGVLLYMLVMLGVGFWSSRQVKNISDFLIAGRKLPFYLALATMFATWFGAGSCLGAAGTAYTDGILGVISDPFAAGLSLILAGFFYVRLLRRMKLMTVTEIFGRYYSKNAEIFASVLMVPVYIGWLGSQIVALGYIINVFTGLSAVTGMWIGAAIVIIYTYSGGMWAVTLTDLIQVIFVALGLCILFPLVMKDVGGLNHLIAETPKRLWAFFPQQGSYNDWVTYFGQWALLGLGCVVGQDLVQRSLSSKNERVARDSAVVAGVLYILFGMIPVLLGLAGRLVMPGLENPEHLVPHLALRYMSPVLIVLFLGALISAIMSSADSSLLAATSLMTYNIFYRLFPDTPDDKLLKFTRIATVLVGAASLAVALYVKQIYNLMINSWATLFVGILVPATAALYWKKANTPAAWTSMILGTAVWTGYILIQTGNLTDVSDPVFYAAASYGGIVSLLSYVIVTLSIYGKIHDRIPAKDLVLEE